MTLLGQQELMTPPPRRRLIVPVGYTAWWGVDPSTKRVAIGWITQDGERESIIESFPGYEGAQRLHTIARATCELALRAPLPGLVFVEQASGQHDNPELLYAIGATLSGLYAALGPLVRIEMVTSSWWKKRACGRGNIYKPTKKKLGRTPVFEDYGVAVWARENGYTRDLWDEADAWGIAEAARREVLLEAR